eukprot:277097_1
MENLSVAEEKQIVQEIHKAMQKSIIKFSDMNNELKSEASDIVISAADKHGKNFEVISRTVKETMDKKFGPSWHCIIGEGFGYEITHEQKHMLYMFYQTIAIVLFKC